MFSDIIDIVFTCNRIFILRGRDSTEILQDLQDISKYAVPIFIIVRILPWTNTKAIDFKWPLFILC